jgi:uncharacterized protein (TIGR02996 family)
MTDTEDAFLRAICEQPDEDTPRLVFADWLDEQGGEVNAEWAELIRDQLHPGSGGWTIYRDFTKDWLDSWGTRLGFPATMSFGKWKRGFPIRLDAPAHDLLAEWDRVFCLVPVTELDIWQATDADVEELAAACDLRNLRALSVQSKVPQGNEVLFTDRALVALAECPALSELGCLSVQWVGLTDRGADAVLCSPHLAHLREFQLGRDPNFAATFGACERIRARFGSKAIR